MNRLIEFITNAMTKGLDDTQASVTMREAVGIPELELDHLGGI